MSKRICPDCGRSLTLLDRFFCTSCGCKLPKSLVVDDSSKIRKITAKFCGKDLKHAQ